MKLLIVGGVVVGASVVAHPCRFRRIHRKPKLRIAVNFRREFLRAWPAGTGWKTRGSLRTGLPFGEPRKDRRHDERCEQSRRDEAPDHDARQWALQFSSISG